MKPYLSLLRGINVSGQKKIKMADLKSLYEKIGFEQVKTYIQSGNVLFKAPQEDQQLIAEKISTAILDQYGFEVPVHIINPARLKEILNQNPFKDAKENLSFVTFLSHKPEKENWNALQQFCPKNEFMAMGTDYLYLHFPNGAGRAKLSNNIIERKLNCIATTRNIKTSRTLLELYLNAFCD